eukprot:362430-Chlamydomonas_euryale.AAC.4
MTYEEAHLRGCQAAWPEGCGNARRDTPGAHDTHPQVAVQNAAGVQKLDRLQQLPHNDANLRRRQAVWPEEQVARDRPVDMLENEVHLQRGWTGTGARLMARCSQTACKGAWRRPPTPASISLAKTNGLLRCTASGDDDSGEKSVSCGLSRTACFGSNSCPWLSVAHPDPNSPFQPYILCTSALCNYKTEIKREAG